MIDVAALDRIVTVVLAGAVRGLGDYAIIEPDLATGDYAIRFERAGAVHLELALASRTCTGVIARLALLANLDLCTSHPTTGLVAVRSGDRCADVMVTIRPGAELRAEVSLVPPRSGAAPLAEPAAGTLIGAYRVLDRLGEGGMGTVYRVEHVVLGRLRALKVLRAAFSERDADAAPRFLREARAAARIEHPNIIDVFDFGHLEDGRPYFVMELLGGESLAGLLERGPLPLHEVVPIARQLAVALVAAHAVGVIHADVTPNNAFVVETDPVVVKLLDFGLAELVGRDATAVTAADFVVGTPAYISPEQIRGLPATDRSDQYSFGIVLYELLAGVPPYQRDDLHALCLDHIGAPIPEATSPLGPIPPELADIVRTCLQKSPSARFPGMAAVVAALDAVRAHTQRSGWRRFLS